MDYSSERAAGVGNKLHTGAVFICSLGRVGRRNVARTHRLFKTGIAMLNVALVLYMIGFLSPYWIVGDNHAYEYYGTRNRTDGRGDDDDDADDGDVKFHLSDFYKNQTHFGVWEECVLIDGESICTIFAEDIGERPPIVCYVMIMFVRLTTFTLMEHFHPTYHLP